MRENVQDNQDLLQGIAKVAKRFYVESEYDPSIVETFNALDESVEIDSVITSTRFAFDAEILASKRYQRTLDFLHRIELRQAELKNDLKTVAGGNVDQNHVAVSAKYAPRGTDNVQSDPEPEQFNTASESLQKGDPMKSSTGLLEGNADLNSHLPSRSYILPEISVEALNLQNDAQADDTFFEIDNVDSSPSNSNTDLNAGTAGHRRTPSESISQSQIPGLEFEAGSVQRSISVGSEGRMRTQTSPSPNLSEAKLQPILSGPAGLRLEPQSQRPSGEWLDSTFNASWAHEDVAKTYRSRTLTHKDVVFIGDSCVGITSAITRAIDGSWMTAYRPTVLDEYSLDVTLNDARFNLRLWDTSGEHSDQLRLLSYTCANLVVIGYAIDSPDSLANVREKVCADDGGPEFD